MLRRFIMLLILSAALNAQGQDLFIPRNLQRAYEKNTRSTDGQPGPKYWQNRAAYTLGVSLDPKKHRLSGTGTITYVNNSPDTLKYIRLKLAHDMYRKGAQRADEVNPDDVDEGVRIEALSCNGQPVEEKSRRRHDTFLDIQLGAAPLMPGNQASISVQWSYTLPADKKATRECVCDAGTFFVSYWYPQVAVYDDYHGWADAPYTGLQEFYNDFSDYDVRISMPQGYMVWATGEWQNAADILTSPYLDRFNSAHSSADIVKIFTEAELKTGNVFQKGRRHEYYYKASGVPDVAFASSNHYNWDASSVVVDERSGRRTFVSAAYDTHSTDFAKVARIAADGIRLMSTWLPGYPFPYPCETVFNGNDGMEYPMMVNDASTSENFVTSLTVHEVSHTYFPFMMGINEQDYAWMDEGWASFFDYNIADSLTGNRGNNRGYSFAAGNESDVPPMVRSRYLSGPAYGTASYARPQNAYLMLQDLLGYETFHRCMVAYMDRWKGKHPMPYDFFNTWNQVSGQNLNWFWKPWFFEWGYPDLAIQSVFPDLATGRDVVVVAKAGALPVPVFAEVQYTDGSSETFHETAAVWRGGNSTTRIEAARGKSIAAVTIGMRSVPDTNRNNNSWKKE